MIKPLILIVISTIAYYLPGQLVDIKDVSPGGINPDFYRFYCLYTSGLFFLIAAYSVVLFLEVPITRLKPKLLYFYLMIAEIYTFIKHVINKLMDLDIYRPNSILLTLIVFAVCSVFMVRRAIRKLESDRWRPGRTYIVNRLPMDFSGLINYIFQLYGHKSILQNQMIYGFHKSSRILEERKITADFINKDDIFLKEVPNIPNIKDFVGKKYNALTFNCNHFIRHATGT